MSDTPRTDDRINRISIENEDSCCAIYVKIDGKESDCDLIDAHFAQQLERELTAVTAERDSLSTIVQSSYQLFQSIADEDDAGHFQINHNLRRRLDALCHEIKTTT